MDGQTLWDWLSNPINQQTLAWIGGGVAVVVTGAWAAFKFLRTKPSISADRGSVAAGHDAHVSFPPQAPVRKKKR